jgi:hypothetical protein
LQPDAVAETLVGGLLANLNVSQASDLWA